MNALLVVLRRVFMVCVFGLSVSASAWAGPEHGGVSPGPLTALEKLQSAPALIAERDKTPAVHVSLARWTTAEGLRVMWSRNTQLPLLDVRLVFDAGAAREGELSGAAVAVSDLLDEGTQTRSAQQVAEGFEQIGANFTTASYRDMALVSLRVMSDAARRDAATSLLSEVVSQPRFAADDWQRLQESMRLNLRQRMQSPAGRAGQTFYQSLYGNHPYSRMPGGDTGSIERMTPADIAAFHQRYYTAKNGVLVLVGDITRADAEMLATRLSRALPVGEKAPALPAVMPLAKAERVHQVFSSEQVHIVLGEVGISRTDPDYFALMVGNELLGGSGFGTLLTRELREKRGLTYSVTSQFIPMRAAGPFQISFSTRHDQATEALALTRQLLSDFVRQGPTEADVSAAKANLSQAFPRSVASNDQVASFLAMIGFYELPDSFIDDYIGQLAAVDLAQVRAAMSRHIHPERLLVVTVGRLDAKATKADSKATRWRLLK
ncbi:MAG: pitrilysin family protein [Paraperlucidibaca sp.]